MRDKNVLVVGLGRSGIAATQTMLDIGARVTIQDMKKETAFDPNLVSYMKGRGVSCYFDSIPHDMGAFDMIILSPGVNPELPFIAEGRTKGAEITGELEIAYRVSKGRFVAITGTNGKTTTTTLVGEIFKMAGRKTAVVGNIGVAAIHDAAIADEDTWLVTETSSFQLETVKYFKPVVSAILNLTPDHLDRHHTMEVYGALKARIYENQSEDGFLIINYDDKLCYSLAKNCKCNVIPFSRETELERGAFVKDGKLVIREGGETIEICAADDLKIIGAHNIENVLAASAISYYAGVAPEIITDAVIAFAGVEHRIEYCGEIDGVKYYNDSKGTNVDAALTALNAIKSNIILIAGGDGKGQDFTEFVKAFNGRVKKMILLGRDGPIIAETADKCGFSHYCFCKDMPECVATAAALAVPGDTVLLSPACASWDMYDNFEQRGEHFKSCVDALER